MPAGSNLKPTESQIADCMTALSAGDSLAKISKRIGISITTLWRMCEEDKDLFEMYTRAKQQKAQYLAEEIVDIADNTELKAEDKRIMVDARKWVAGKYYGKLFGDRTTIDATINDYSNMDPDQRRRRILELQQQLENAEKAG